MVLNLIINQYHSPQKKFPMSKPTFIYFLKPNQGKLCVQNTLLAPLNSI